MKMQCIAVHKKINIKLVYLVKSTTWNGKGKRLSNEFYMSVNPEMLSDLCVFEIGAGVT